MTSGKLVSSQQHCCSADRPRNGASGDGYSWAASLAVQAGWFCPQL